ncbi:O-antigen ligase [Pseudoxanthomonas sp. 3HH-4]|uniref:O-antigen ligase family protein n=1 Tax=Pseudoxanthomonas sp. 3HH-4 TaxID=1690214 RepID=UPI00117313A6|nr:O-antigen ligase family protein [Pseudoxanthomonas sp. 3HH-4]TQM17144.1 O-antigen ligase [Pseudoxanthomonas sp. 3HH-4]
MQGRSHRRQDVARAFAWLSGFSVPALLVVPKGLGAFAVLMLVATLLALPDAWRSRGERTPRALHLLLGTALVVLAVAALSMWGSGADMSALDNPSRALLLPWCAWLAWSTRVRVTSLWYGALAGLALAFTISMAQASLGADRAGGEANPIVFANAVLALLVVGVFCRPPRNGFLMQLLLAALVALAVVAVILSGSRGVLPGLGLVVLMLLAGSEARHRGWRLGATGVALALLLAALWTVPWLSAQFRLDQLHADVAGYTQGQVDQPISARLALWSVAWDAFREAPFTGVGIEAFASRVDASIYCRGASRHFCGLEHAHNDVAQWAATMGVPGVAVLLAFYGVPLATAVFQVRHNRLHAPVGPSWAAGILVAAYMVSGLTQSMFSHALSTSAYVVLVGLLLGMGMAPRDAVGNSIRSIGQAAENGSG